MKPTLLIWIFYFIGQVFMTALIGQTSISSKMNGINDWKTYFRIRGLNVAARLFISICLVMFFWSSALAALQKIVHTNGGLAACAGLSGFAFDALLDKLNGVLAVIIPGFHIDVPPK